MKMQFGPGLDSGLHFEAHLEFRLHLGLGLPLAISYLELLGYTLSVRPVVALDMLDNREGLELILRPKLLMG